MEQDVHGDPPRNRVRPPARSKPRSGSYYCELFFTWNRVQYSLASSEPRELGRWPLEKTLSGCEVVTDIGTRILSN